MTTLLQFEPNPVSETEQPRPLFSLDGEEFAPLPVEHGRFDFALTDIRQVLECAFSLLQPDVEYHRIREEAWQKKWGLSPAEYYPRVLGQLEKAQSLAGAFGWESFGPVYSPVDLASGALELGLGDAQCKVCQRSFTAAELEVFGWSRFGSFKGREYVCPEEHVLLRTERFYLGEACAPYIRYKQERRTTLCLPQT
jgi:hypothetical protein